MAAQSNHEGCPYTNSSIAAAPFDKLRANGGVGAALVAAQGNHEGCPYTNSSIAAAPFDKLRANGGVGAALVAAQGNHEGCPYTNSSMSRSSIAAATREMSVCWSVSRCAPPMSSRGRAANEIVMRDGPMAHSR